MRYLPLVQRGGAEGFILDLRNNPGGLVRAGLDIARLWLDGNAAIFNVQGREDNGHMAIMQVSFAVAQSSILWGLCGTPCPGLSMSGVPHTHCF